MPSRKMVRGRKAPKSTLGRLLGSEARARVLTALLLGAPERSYVRDLAKRLALPPTAVSRELLTLERLGIVRREAEGRRIYCTVRPEAAVLPELRALALKLGGIADVLRELLRDHRAAIRWAFLYGSMATGDATASSDVDLFVVGAIRPMVLNELLRPIADGLGREINSFVLTAAEFREKRRSKNHFVTRVLAGPRLELIGDARSAETAD
jgi:predicted nucleotidyltransferase